MGLPDPRKRKPTASEVASWASRIGKRLDVDGYYGAQCWDLPNFIFKRYWNFLQQVTLLLWRGIAILEGLNFTEIQLVLYPNQAIWLYGVLLHLITVQGIQLWL